MFSYLTDSLLVLLVPIRPEEFMCFVVSFCCAMRVQHLGVALQVLANVVAKLPRCEAVQLQRVSQ